MMKKTKLIAPGMLIFVLSLSLSCSKIEFKKMESPAYLRVFNNLRFKLTVENKEQSLSVLTMLIDPVFDTEGLPVSAATTGDFLITRDTYAPPYPSHIGNSVDVFNPEYPGKEKVMAAPILNGYDLSSWAQVPSGQKRVLFYFRPKSQVPFFNLEARFRTSPVIDTVLSLEEKEVYTLNVLQKDFETKKNGLLLRKEVFHKLPLADSLVYVNFYNMSAKGYVEAPSAYKPSPIYYHSDMAQGVRNEMKVYYTLSEKKGSYQWNNPLQSHDRVYMTTMKRNTESPETSTYYHFPLFAKQNGKVVESSLYQFFYFLAPGYDINQVPWGAYSTGNDGRYTFLTCYLNGKVDPSEGSAQIGTLIPNLIATTHSGEHNPRSFGTVNTIEIVNGDAYLTTVQRVFAPPTY
jgi:hypothetical protein